MIKNLAPLLVAIAVIAAGCSSASTMSNGSDADALLERLRQSYASVPEITLSGTMKISGMGITVWHNALVRGRDSIRIDLTGPFGVPVGAMSATPGSFIFYNAQEGIAYEGRPDRPTFSRLMMIGLDYDEMVSLIRGEIPRIPQPGSYEHWREGDAVTYKVDIGGRVETFSINPSDLTVTSYRRTYRSGDHEIVELAIDYRDFTKVGERQFPKRASVEVLDGEQKMIVEIAKIAADIDADRSLALHLPDGVERIRL